MRVNHKSNAFFVRQITAKYKEPNTSTADAAGP